MEQLLHRYDLMIADSDTLHDIAAVVSRDCHVELWLRLLVVFKVALLQHKAVNMAVKVVRGRVSNRDLCECRQATLLWHSSSACHQVLSMRLRLCRHSALAAGMASCYLLPFNVSVPVTASLLRTVVTVALA